MCGDQLTGYTKLTLTGRVKNNPLTPGLGVVCVVSARHPRVLSGCQLITVSLYMSLYMLH